LLSYKFREFGSVTALSILEATNAGVKEDNDKGAQITTSALKQSCIFDLFSDLSPGELSILFTPFDLKRLESYANNMLDYHVILDLMPVVANLYFQKRLQSGKGAVNAEGQEIQLRLTAVQSSILLALGLQRKTIDDLEVSIKGYPRSYEY
jgi:N-acetyltransferase 10